MHETFLVERYWPGARREDVAAAEDRLDRAALELVQEGTPVRIVSSTWVPADEVVLTLFEAGEKDDVVALGRRGGYPIDRMQRVEVVTETNRRWRGEDEQV